MKPSVETFSKILRSIPETKSKEYEETCRPSGVENVVTQVSLGVRQGLSCPKSGVESASSSPNEIDGAPQSNGFLQKIGTKRKLTKKQLENAYKILQIADSKSILNLKEIQSFTTVENVDELPKDIFNIICDHIIHVMEHPETLEFTEFREKLYDILIYNLDITECLWYIFRHFIQRGYISGKKDPTTKILSHIYVFLKYYNNNYRPIYHLESIFFYLLLQIDTTQ
jgi:hypothetical protein